jgi:inorganic triphosphatase YgiF
MYTIYLVSEIETPILILLNDTKLINEKIKRLIGTSGYNTTDAETVIIHDEYYDTKTNVLIKNKANLRIRTINNKDIKITLKQEKEKEKHKAYFDRLEIEKSWSYSFYEELLTNMESISNQFHDLRNKYGNDPKQTFNSLGLDTILRKNTKRSIINALNVATNQIEFEFAFDYVSIFVKPKDWISFLELEIESKNKGNQSKINQFVSDIVKDENFIQWSHNKLETGLAAKRLYEKAELKKIEDYDENYVLTRTGLGKIESYLNYSDFEYP